MTPPVAAITRAARGVGAAVARRLAADGRRLVLVDRCRDDAALAYPLATLEELDAVTAETAGVAMMGDVRDKGAFDYAIALALERFDGLDAAAAVAGCVAGGQDAWVMPEATWEAMVGVNLEGVWRLARAAVPALLRQPEPRQGRFVAVSSATGTRAFPCCLPTRRPSTARSGSCAASPPNWGPAA